MKLRLRPLRGQMYGPCTFIEKHYDFKITNAVVVLLNDGRDIVNIDKLNLPIIDTKDYEKIPDEKYRGD